MIEAGALDCRIRIEQAAESLAAGTRETVRTWPPAGGALVGEVWAARLPASGREFYSAQQRIAEVEQGWRIRYQRSIAETVTASERFRIVDQAGRAFDVLEVREPEGTRGEALLLFGRARAD